jgi:hypothetical protein
MHIENFCYKVIYPGGTFVRISPALDAEKTGEILEYGAVFCASKSLFLDGINYVKLSDGRGWLFESRGSTQVLQLLEVTRSEVSLIAIASDISIKSPIQNTNGRNSPDDGCNNRSYMDDSNNDLVTAVPSWNFHKKNKSSKDLTMDESSNDLVTEAQNRSMKTATGIYQLDYFLNFIFLISFLCCFCFLFNFSSFWSYSSWHSQRT